MTSGQKLLLHARTEDAHHAAPADKIYLAVGDKEEPNVIKGFLRVGRKHLFLEVRMLTGLKRNGIGRSTSPCAERDRIPRARTALSAGFFCILFIPKTRNRKMCI